MLTIWIESCSTSVLMHNVLRIFKHGAPSMYIENIALWSTLHSPWPKHARLWTRLFRLVVPHFHVVMGCGTCFGYGWPRIAVFRWTGAGHHITMSAEVAEHELHKLHTSFSPSSTLFIAKHFIVLRAISWTNYQTTPEELQDGMSQLLIDFEPLVHNAIYPAYPPWLH